MVPLIAAALIRQDAQVLLVEQQGPDDPAPTWALPWRAMREPLVAYLSGKSAAGSVWLYRRQANGRVELARRFSPDDWPH